MLFKQYPITPNFFLNGGGLIQPNESTFKFHPHLLRKEESKSLSGHCVAILFS